MDDIRKIYYKSDFDFEVNLGGLADRNMAEAADLDFEGTVFPELRPGKGFRFSRTGDVWINCVPGESSGAHSCGTGLSFRVTCDRHNLPPGPLSLELTVHFPDPDYPDGCRRQVCRHSLPIELVTGECDCGDAAPASVRVTLPYIYASAYDLAKANGYTGTREEYYAAIADMPDSVAKVKDALDKLEQGGSGGTGGQAPVKVIRYDESTGTLYL